MLPGRIYALAVVVTVALGVCSPRAVAATLPAQYVGGGVVVHCRPRDERQARQVIALAEGLLRELRHDLGVEVRRAIEVYLVRGDEELREYAGNAAPEWALAVARAESGQIVIDVSRAGDSLPNNFVLTFRHEVVHVALGQVEAGTGVVLPLWFHEGVATWISGCRLGLDRNAFFDAAGAGHLIPLRDLAGVFPRQPSAADLAYMETEDFIRYLVEQGGDDTLVRIVAGLHRERSFAAAVAGVLGRPLGTLEADWRAGLRSKHPLLTMLLRHLSLFGLMAIATVAAYILVRRRRRRRRRQWAREEREFTMIANDDYEDGDEDGYNDEENDDHFPFP